MDELLPTNYQKIFVPFFAFIIFLSFGFCQVDGTKRTGQNQMKLYSNYILSSNSQLSLSDSETLKSLAYKENFNKKWGRVNLPSELLDDNFKPWE